MKATFFTVLISYSCGFVMALVIRYGELQEITAARDQAQRHQAEAQAAADRALEICDEWEALCRKLLEQREPRQKSAVLAYHD